MRHSVKCGIYPETVSVRQFLEMVYEETGHPLKMQIELNLLVKALGLFNSQIREVVEMLVCRQNLWDKMWCGIREGCLP